MEISPGQARAALGMIIQFVKLSALKGHGNRGIHSLAFHCPFRANTLSWVKPRAALAKRACPGLVSFAPAGQLP